MTQVSDPTAAATSGQSDPLADAATAWQKFVAAFAANNQGAASIQRAQQDVIAAQAELAQAQHDSSDLKAAVGHAFADLENVLEGLGVQIPAADATIPNPPATDSGAATSTPPAATDSGAGTSTGTTDATATDPTAGGSPVVVDPITGVHVPVDEETGAPIPVPPIPDVTPTTGTDTSSSTSDASSSGSSDATSTGGTDTTSSGTVTPGTDPNAGSGDTAATDATASA